MKYFSTIYKAIQLSCWSLTALLFVACTPITTRPKGTFTQELHARQIPISPVIDPDNMTLAGDYVVTCSSRCDTILSFFHREDLSFKGSKGIKGGGPEDYTMPWLYNGLDGNLYVRGFNQPNAVAQFAMPKNHPYQLQRIYKPDAELFCLNFGTVLDSLLIGYRQANNITLSVYDLANHQLLSNKTFEVNEENSMGSMQENKGIPAVTRKGTVAYAYKCQNRIDFFHIDEQYQLQEISTVEDAQNTNTQFNDPTGIKTYYVNIVGTENKFYALCRNGHPDGNNDVLEVYTAQGEPIVTYQFDNVAPLLYCIDEKKRLLYGYRYDMPDTFLIYSLP